MAQNWWEKGAPVGDTPQQSGGVQIKGADKKLPLELEKMRGEIARQGRDAATAPYDAEKAAAEARKAKADATVAEAKAKEASVSDPLQVLAQKRLGQDELISIINQARREINSGILPAVGFGSSISRKFGGTSGTDLAGSLNTIGSKTVLEKLGELKTQSATGASGLGALSEKEAAYLRDSIASLDQGQSKEKLLDSLARIEKHYRRLNALADGQNPDDQKVAQAYGIALNPPGRGGNGGDGVSGGTPANPTPGGSPTAEGKWVADPALKGVNSHIAALIKRGASGDEVRAYLNTVQPGLGGRSQNIDAWVNFHRQNPAKPIAVDVEKAWKPNSPVAQAIGSVGMSPVGTGIINAADMLTAGTLDNMTDNPALARAAMSGVSAENPKSAFLGQMGGGALAAGGMELGAAGLLGKATPWAARGADALYGSLYGAGSADEGSRLTGGALGGATGVAGGMFGRAAGRGIGRAAQGVTNTETRLLNDAGVPMTVGQVMGGGLKSFEDRLAGFPIVGDAINARRREGIQGFNQAAFNEGLSPIGATTNGQIGAPGVDLARQARSDAYSAALDPVTVQADATFITDMQAAIQAGQKLPSPMKEGLDYTLPTRVGQSFDANGNLTGRDFQQALRGLRRDAKSVANQPYGYDFGQVAGQAEDALTGILSRQSPDTLPAYNAANAANRNVEVLRDAVNRARNGTRSGQTDVFMPSQLSDAAAANAKAFGGTQGTTNQPFFDLTRAGQSTLPSAIPDSGTAGRLMVPAIAGALGGAGGAFGSEGDVGDRAQSGLGYGLGLATLAAAPYSKAAQKTLQRAMLQERPDIVVNLGKYIADRSKRLGMFGVPLGLGYETAATGGY